VEPLTNDRVMDEFAQNCERRLLCQLLRLRDGVADAETHSEMLSQNDFHLVSGWNNLTLCYKVTDKFF
jgi:hypothetical protein